MAGSFDELCLIKFLVLKALLLLYHLRDFDGDDPVLEAEEPVHPVADEVEEEDGHRNEDLFLLLMGLVPRHDFKEHSDCQRHGVRVLNHTEEDHALHPLEVRCPHHVNERVDGVQRRQPTDCDRPVQGDIVVLVNHQFLI